MLGMDDPRQHLILLRLKKTIDSFNREQRSGHSPTPITGTGVK